MALGDNNKKQNYENTFYSRLKFTNYDEKKMLSFSYWKTVIFFPTSCNPPKGIIFSFE